MVYTNVVRSRKRLFSAALRASLISIPLLSASAAFAFGLAGVRSTDETVSALITEGAARSASFQRLLERVDELNGIVYVEFGDCAFGHLNGCLLPFVVPTTGGRYLRIVVTPDRTRVDHDGLIALLAHELQHALEVLAHPDVVDLDSMLAMFAKIGRPLSGRSGYETSEAHAVQDSVASELRSRARRPHSAVDDTRLRGGDSGGTQ
ncbi:MAG TPA: hypothetical protein VKE51_32510 [Vicinamibacterales bacterium]|nr:hypothetical protein [Vicinamibacterales bacterium]